LQIGWLISTATGVGTLLALDRVERRADFVAPCCLASRWPAHMLGVPFVVTAAIDVALGRRHWRDGLDRRGTARGVRALVARYQTPGPRDHLPLTDMPLYVVR
jgi:hypothetical protein